MMLPTFRLWIVSLFILGASKIAAEADTRDNGFESKGDLNMPDIRHKDQFADITMANSDFKVVVEANKKIKESLELSGEKRSSEGTPRMLKKDEPKESIKLEISSGGRATSAVAEQEAHSRFVKAEVSISYAIKPHNTKSIAFISVAGLEKRGSAVFYFIFCWNMHFD